jgi:predicted Rossmann-fold nucleotide-binding protein
MEPNNELRGPVTFKWRSIVGVMGDSRDEHRLLSEPLGRSLATLGVHLLIGGGGGVMKAVARAFAGEKREGSIIGIIPSLLSCQEPSAALGHPVVRNWRPKVNYPNEYVEIPIYTHLPESGLNGKFEISRNHINVLSADIVLRLPGGSGTQAEEELATEYGRPLWILTYPEVRSPESCAQRVASLVEEVRRKLPDKRPVRA